MAELLLGSHCSVESCNQLDFLPCTCNGCGRVFCKLHMCYAAHDCPRHDLVTPRDPLATPDPDGAPRSYRCAVAGCARREMVPVWCEHCTQNFCLQHRLQVDHACSSLQAVRSERMQRTAQHVQAILAARAAHCGASKANPTSDRARAMAVRVELMKLKQSATGDKSTPDIDRIYLRILLPEPPTDAPTAPFIAPPVPVAPPDLPSCSMFFSRRWSVGRIIDGVAAAQGLRNKNNVSGERKLRMFDAVTGEVIPSERVIASLMEGEAGRKSEEETDVAKEVRLYNGCKVVLEYVDDDTVSGL